MTLGDSISCLLPGQRALEPFSQCYGWQFHTSFQPRVPPKIWVAVKELKLSYHNGYI